MKSGDIYLGKYAGWYAVRDEAYYSADELKERPERQKDRALRRGMRMG